MLSVLSVSEFITQVNDIVAGEFIIEGEVSQFNISQSKWIYFSLKDDKAMINCFSTVYSIKTPLEDGMKVRVIGYPKIYEKTGKFSLTVQKVELVGEGSLKKAYLLLKEKLTKEGIFNAERKRSLPKIPKCIGVVASRDSAAWGDFQRILNNRWSGVEVLLYHIQVQGENAVKDIINAFDYFNSNSNECEEIVLIRGGGSLEDLAAFNSEEVVRAIYGSRLPVVCGVGHERDESLADFAADVRASTPSNAAEIVVPDKKEFLSELDFTKDHIIEKMNRRLVSMIRIVEQSFYYLSSGFEKPLSQGKMLVEKFEMVRLKILNRFGYLKEFVSSSERLMNNINPKRLLKQGYSIVRDKEGKVLRSKKNVDFGAKLMVEFSDGVLAAEVLAELGKKQQAKLFGAD